MKKRFLKTILLVTVLGSILASLTTASYTGCVLFGKDWHDRPVKMNAFLPLIPGITMFLLIWISLKILRTGVCKGVDEPDRFYLIESVCAGLFGVEIIIAMPFGIPYLLNLILFLINLVLPGWMPMLCPL
jgi:hypothetical protein